MSISAALNRFLNHLFRQNVRSLKISAYLFVLPALIHWMADFPFSSILFSNHSPFFRIDLLDPSRAFDLLLISPSDLWVYALEAACVLFAGLFLWGKTHKYLYYSAFALIQISMINHLRLGGFVNASDDYYECLLSIGFFAPWNKLNLTQIKEKKTADAPFFSVFYFLILTQSVLIYFFAALFKNGKAWMVDYNAVELLVSRERGISFFANYLYLHPLLAKLGTQGTLLFEFCIPILLLIPIARPALRKVLSVIIILFHVGLVFTLPYLIHFLFVFSVFPFVYGLNSDPKKADLDLLNVRHKRFSLLELASGTATVCFFAILVCANFASLQKARMRYPAWIFAKQLGISQGWGMFNQVNSARFDTRILVVLPGGDEFTLAGKPAPHGVQSAPTLEDYPDDLGPFIGSARFGNWLRLTGKMEDDDPKQLENRRRLLAYLCTSKIRTNSFFNQVKVVKLNFYEVETSSRSPSFKVNNSASELCKL